MMVLHFTSAACTIVEKRSDKKEVYVLTVVWEKKPDFSITRTFFDFFDFTSNLKNETKDTKGIKIPSLPALKWFQKFGNTTEKRKSQVNEFCKEVIKVTKTHNSDALEEGVERFFSPWMNDLNPVPKEQEKSPEKEKDKGKEKKDKKKEKKDRKLEKQISVDKKKKDPQIAELEQVLRHHGGESSTDTNNYANTQPDSQPNTEPDPNNLYIVSTDYLEPEEGQLALQTGWLVEVMERTLTGWWFVCCEDAGIEGWAPASILEPLDPYSSDVIHPEAGAVPGTGEKFRALADYKARKEDELTYKRGDTMEIMSMSLDGWWTAKCGDKTGLVSATNLENTSSSHQGAASTSSDLYETCTLNQQHSIYKKKPPPRRDPSICLSELYAKVHKPLVLSPGPKPEPLSPKPRLDSRNSIELYGPPPEVPKKNMDLRYSEIVFDDDKPGVPRTVEVEDERTIYSEIVLDSPPKPTPQKQTHTRPTPQKTTQSTSGPAPLPPKGQSLKFYKAIEDVSSEESEGLSIHIGDILVCRQELDDVAMCELCKQEKRQHRTGKGWVKKSALQWVHCEVTGNENGVLLVRQQAPKPTNRKNPETTERKPPENGSHPGTSGSKPGPPRMQPLSHEPATRKPSMKDLSRYPWFAGQMDRTTCGDFMSGAKDDQFLVRETKGEYSLSVASQGRVRHFQIKLTDNGQYGIGGHNFSDLKSIVKHYKSSPLFYADSENKQGRRLGEPFVKMP